MEELTMARSATPASPKSGGKQHKALAAKTAANGTTNGTTSCVVDIEMQVCFCLGSAGRVRKKRVVPRGKVAASLGA